MPAHAACYVAPKGAQGHGSSLGLDLIQTRTQEPYTMVMRLSGRGGTKGVRSPTCKACHSSIRTRVLRVAVITHSTAFLDGTTPGRLPGHDTRRPSNGCSIVHRVMVLEMYPEAAIAGYADRASYPVGHLARVCLQETYPGVIITGYLSW